MSAELPTHRGGNALRPRVDSASGSSVKPEPAPRMAISRCRSCTSSRLWNVNAEICIHFPGLEGVNKAPIFGFPKLVVCSECGFVETALSGAELQLLKENGGVNEL